MVRIWGRIHFRTPVEVAAATDSRVSRELKKESRHDAVGTNDPQPGARREQEARARR
jgi:hypothetical protein